MQAKIYLAVLLSFLIILPLEVSAVGTGTQADPFIINSLVFDAQFVAKNYAGGSPQLLVNGIQVLSSSGTVTEVYDKANVLQNGANTVIIRPPSACCTQPVCTTAKAALRIGDNQDGNIISSDGTWTSQGTVHEIPSNCIITADLSLSNNEKCIYSEHYGTCNEYYCEYCSYDISKTFYVRQLSITGLTITPFTTPSSPFKAGDSMTAAFSVSSWDWVKANVPYMIFRYKTTDIVTGSTSNEPPDFYAGMPDIVAQNFCDSNGYCTMPGTFTTEQFNCSGVNTDHVRKREQWIVINGVESSHASFYFRCSDYAHCSRCSTTDAYQWIDFNTTDTTCTQVLPPTNPVTRTCNCTCPAQGLGTSWDPNCVSSCISANDKVQPNIRISGAPSGWTKTVPLTATIYCQDNAGGSGCDTSSFKLKKSQTKITCTAVPANGPIPSDYTESPEQLDDGSYGIREITSQMWVCAAGKDIAGNFNYTKYPANFSIDAVPPTVTTGNESSGWSPPAWVRSNNLTVNCTDSLAGCLPQIYYSFVPAQNPNCPCSGQSTSTGSVLVNTDHNDYLCICVKDNAGNENKAVSRQLMVDATSPSTSNDVNPAQWYGDGEQRKISCTDGLSGCSKIYYCMDNQGGTCTPATAVPNPGTDSNFDALVTVSCSAPQSSCSKIIRYYAEDRAGNRDGSSASPRTTPVIKIDKSIPTCMIKTPASAYTNSNSIMVSWNASSPTGASPLANVTVARKAGDAEWNEAWSVQQVNIQSIEGSRADTPVADGLTYSYKCKASNQLGAEGSWSADAVTTVRLNAPPVQITAPANCQAPAGCWTNATSIVLAWASEDEASVRNYTLFYKGGSVSSFTAWTQLGGIAKSAEFGKNDNPIKLENNRTYTFRVMVTDIAWNVKNSTDVAVRIDTGKPNCMINSLPAYQPAGANSFTASWSGTDGESGIQGDKYVLWLKAGSNPWTVYKNLGNSKLMEDAADGVYRLKCAAMDAAGNMGDNSTEKNTTVDSNPPQIFPVFNDTVDQGQNLTVRATITDAIKVSSVALSYGGNIIPPARNPSTNLNQSVWDVTWTISNLTTTGLKPFKITVTDVNGNSNSTDYEFMVKLCDEGATQKCGACGSGTKTCVNGNFTNCVGEDRTLIKTEICNGYDDNCDLIIDNMNGSIDPQATHCACTYQPESKIQEIQAQQETCNGMDDDCDGQTDESGGCCKEGDTQPCGADTGICRNREKTCTDQKWGPCEWEIGPNPQGEICDNGKDDNCNGIVDDGCTACVDADGDGYGDPASNLCTYPEQDCDDSDPNISPGMPETCNEIDDNCNDETDEELSCDHCTNQEQDADEEGTDCGGVDCPACFVWGWLWLTAGGIVILLTLAFVWLHFKRQGRELTWEELKKKWTPSE
jgi:hypothetical protein